MGQAIFGWPALHFIITGTSVRSQQQRGRTVFDPEMLVQSIEIICTPGSNPAGPPLRCVRGSAFRSITSIRAPVQPELVLISEIHISSYYRATPHPLHFPSYGNQQLSG